MGCWELTLGDSLDSAIVPTCHVPAVTAFQLTPACPRSWAYGGTLPSPITLQPRPRPLPLTQGP